MRPPRLAVWLAGVRLTLEEREFALGDLYEDFRAMAAARGARAARRWYWRQAWRCMIGAMRGVRPEPAASDAPDTARREIAFFFNDQEIVG